MILIPLFLCWNNSWNLFLNQLFNQILLQINVLLKLNFRFVFYRRFLFTDTSELLLENILSFQIIFALDIFVICLNILVHEIFLDYFYLGLFLFCLGALILAFLAFVALCVQKLIFFNFFLFFCFNELNLRCLFCLHFFTVVVTLFRLLNLDCFSDSSLRLRWFVNVIQQWCLSSLVMALAFLTCSHFFVV